MRGLLWSVVGATFLACTPAPPDDGTGGGSAGGGSAGTGGGSGGGASCQVTLSGANPLMGRCELDPFYVAPDSKVSITLQGSMRRPSWA